MHIQISDFGSALRLNLPSETQNSNANNDLSKRRKNSFVGTAQYVSPEMLTNKSATAGSGSYKMIFKYTYLDLVKYLVVIHLSLFL